MEETKPTIMEVDLNSFHYNISQIKKKVGNDVTIMPVIKANAYGTYLNTRLDILNEFDIVACANVDEAVYLRKIGYEKEIFILNQPYNSEIEKIIKYNITVGVCSIEFIKETEKYNENIKIHIEVETGMGRTGVFPDKIEEFIKIMPANIKVEGIYTHLSSADFDDAFTKKQLELFSNAVQTTKKLLGDLKYIHSAASNGIINYPESYFNLIRVGIIMYGYASSNDTLEKIDLKPVTKLKSKITYLKTVNKGTSIGYGRSYITDNICKVATIPIGYADGFRRTFSNGWEVLIKGKKVPIIGNVCMDSFMADVSSLEDVEIGDDVIIWDNENIKVEDLAHKCNTINYEILSTISSRVQRVFI